MSTTTPEKDHKTSDHHELLGTKQTLTQIQPESNRYGPVVAAQKRPLGSDFLPLYMYCLSEMNYWPSTIIYGWMVDAMVAMMVEMASEMAMAVGACRT